MKLHFQSEDLDLFGEGPNVFAALSQIEEKLKVITGTDSVLAEDFEINWTEIIYFNCLERNDCVVGQEDENFTIKKVDSE